MFELDEELGAVADPLLGCEAEPMVDWPLGVALPEDEGVCPAVEPADVV